ncbi:FHA domain containing protein [Pseudarthrobacter chlorophenolicus A6]|uniref:FHA domain containing protein n=1 Tax=Pseudarthrobacter chlorophenolicus (strain ATCC 700700 / DSM 12829 / CIP 107037 / JCM 12360 / KCTC 9906 / NCIMB 13794 / A6) TaxID=452863 RepID=B8HBK3_PSECP|nr:FtsK/SpoIIIE domain-containing protein [Pseudarthrobacter chlorophenolicus]ACL40391.1 FHA domain containing protein [Pseudarthrobacter chlorophenolicus A6]SDQ82438.1 DNA segregation ATPase FtsK/SpoIIIE, S-DNA-T family [Pseudarthrobacter chlorophenolicus]
MTLHWTLVRAAGPGSGDPPLELTIEAPAGTAGTEIHHHLARQFDTGEITVQGIRLGSLSVGTAPLVAGAVLVDAGGAGPPVRKQLSRISSEAEAGLALAVHSGSGAGTVVALARGSFTIGRSGARISIDDAEMSRKHAKLTVTDTGIFIEDLDSSNGTWVDGRRIRNAAVSTASDIRCGSSVMSLVFADSLPGPIADAGASVADPLTVTAGTDHGNRAILVLTATLPLAIGIGLAVFTGMWMFLAFAGASAVSVLIPLLTGRKQRRETAAAVAAAVQKDKERRRRAGPSLATVALRAQRLGSHREGAGDGRIWLRLGLGIQPANISVQPAGAVRGRPSAGALPILLNPSRPETVFRGARPGLDAMIRALVMQLAGYPRGIATRVVIHGQPEVLPLAARFLPRVVLTATGESCRRHLSESFSGDGPHGVLILGGPFDCRETDNTLAATGIQLGWQVLRFTTPGEPASNADVELSEPESSLACQEAHVKFVPDLAPAKVFDAFCRNLAAGEDGRARGDCVPDTCALEEVMPLSAAATAARWQTAEQATGLAVPLGLSAGGVRSWDLDGDGPHLLVAGTTGSGKSELLRTLIVGLALSHPPELVNFLFVDFKGGSGLGPLADLVHCVGLLTDLSASELDRTLASLRAEIRLREEALAAAKVPDLASYRSATDTAGPALPHLVIIIDEFRMLVDDAPEVLRELMRIAAIGRSLGIHLVMATQRPQGALTADIRANVTSSIALRVQSDMESHDIIGTKAAAGIGLDRPGRAFLARGTEPAQEFQAATLNLSGRETRNGALHVQRTFDFLRAVEGGAPGRQTQTPAQAARPYIVLVRTLWAARGGSLPRQPVAPPLPHDLREPVAGQEQARSRSATGSRPDWSIELGAMDLPHAQCVLPLTWEPTRNGHLALIGSASSGAAEALDLAIRRLLAHPRESHCYFLDAPGGLQHAAGHRRTGAHVGIHELRRAVRVLERLVRELGKRLSRPDQGAIPLVLVISGWGSWVSAFRSGPLAWAEDLVQDLVRDGQRAGITVAISGERELATARFGGSLPNRLFFPAASNEDSRLAWPRMPSTAPVKGRAVAFGPVAGSEPAVCQVYDLATADQWQRDTDTELSAKSGTPPFRIESLPPLVSATDVQESAANPASFVAGAGSTPSGLLIGVGGDELSPVRLHLPAGGVFAILGRPGGGKSNSLRALRILNPQACWVYPPDTAEPNRFWTSLLLDPASRTAAGRRILIADDADHLSPDALTALAELQSRGHTVLLTANYNPLLLQRLPLVMASRAHGAGLLLAPRSLADGDLFGVRFEAEPAAPPGRAVLISGGASAALQVAWTPPGAEAAGSGRRQCGL